MHNRIEIAYEFARAIESEDIIRIILFGSVARRDDKEESDIDILIVTPSREKIDSMVDEEVFNINAKYLEVVSFFLHSRSMTFHTKSLFPHCSRYSIASIASIRNMRVGPPCIHLLFFVFLLHQACFH